MTHSATQQAHINAVKVLERISLLTLSDKPPRNPHDELANMALLKPANADEQTRSVA